MLDRINWDKHDVLSFLGQYLTEPKAHVVFERPARPLPEARFVRHALRDGLRLDLKTQMLFRGRVVFINGERHDPGARAARLLTTLADRRCLAPPFRLDDEAAARLYQWYRSGYIVAGAAA
jgi:50S ribosomal protein L16 3-hydroxylase